MDIVRTLVSTDGGLKMLVVRRSDGLFEIAADEFRPEDEEFGAYWTGPLTHVLHGIFESAETAEREAIAHPYFRGRFSH